MSAAGSSTSSAKRASASGSGTRPSSRAARSRTGARSNAWAAPTVAGIACSSPAAAVAVSRRALRPGCERLDLLQLPATGTTAAEQPRPQDDDRRRGHAGQSPSSEQQRHESGDQRDAELAGCSLRSREDLSWMLGSALIPRERRTTASSPRLAAATARRKPSIAITTTRPGWAANPTATRSSCAPHLYAVTSYDVAVRIRTPQLVGLELPVVADPGDLADRLDDPPLAVRHRAPGG